MTNTIFAAPVPPPATRGYGWIPGVHRSLDYKVPKGTPVLAAAPGHVTQVGAYGAMGNTLRIQHANGYETLYGNLGSYTAHPGDAVSTGQQVGTSDGDVRDPNPGDSTGPHLPFQVWHNGKPVNPAPLTADTGTAPATGLAGFNVLNPFAALIPTHGAILRGSMYVAGFVFITIVLVMVVANTEAGQKAAATGRAAAKDAALAAIAVPK